tara:strand:- start:223 stop:477 length:255 start_codon:yes stop_codon:yes gene_type:complete
LEFIFFPSFRITILYFDPFLSFLSSVVTGLKEGQETSFLPLHEVIKIVNNNKMKIVFLYILNLKENYFSNIILNNEEKQEKQEK